MSTVIPVKFKYSAHDLWFNPGETGAKAGDHVVCQTERGQEFGLVTFDAFEAPEEEACPEGRILQPVLRVATEEDLEHAHKIAEEADALFPSYKQLVDASELNMKPVGVEILFEGDKIICYFTSDDRVDFRQLVKDLTQEFGERIDMRQINVREQAAIVGGYAPCGQEMCCVRFGRQFEPVSIRMAKEQDLPLNSSKISGACGRLMCCLRYEFEAYRDFKSRAPKKNALIDTPLGKAKIFEYDTPRERIGLRLENGQMFHVPLKDMEASEAACKKAEECGCGCRPDTVPHAALVALDSPELQAALAELDRKFNPAEEGPDEDDLFATTLKRYRKQNQDSLDSENLVNIEIPDDLEDLPGQARKRREASLESGYGRRRRRSRSGSAAQESPQVGVSAEPTALEPSNSSRKAADRTPRHRRRSRVGADQSLAVESPRLSSSDTTKPRQSDTSPGRSLRRRNYSTSKSEALQSGSAAESENQDKRRPSRRRGTSRGFGRGSQEYQHETSSSSEQRATPSTYVRRRRHRSKPSSSEA